MRYSEFINILHENTGIQKKTIRKVLQSVPETLWELEMNELVRTPLGSFEKTHRKGRDVKLPNGKKASAKAKTIIKLRKSTHLTKLD